MKMPDIKYCPGTLAEGFDTYSKTCLKKVFNGRKVYHVLLYNSPASGTETDELFEKNQNRLSISGVQEKFSVILEKNKLRLVEEGEQATHILKPVPAIGKKADQIPANEHLTMQIASQVYGINTASNALIFFKDGMPAYIVKRFDIDKNGNKLAQEDFASLAGRTPQTHGEHYKYSGNYLELFEILRQYVPAYKIEAPKLLKLLMFNYLFSNGDAHIKNFSLLETSMGDYKLSPAYDLLNTRIHIDDKDFALEDGLLPRNLAQGKIGVQFAILAEKAMINKNIYSNILDFMLNHTSYVEKMIFASFLNEKTKRNYFQSYRERLKRLMKK